MSEANDIPEPDGSADHPRVDHAKRTADEAVFKLLVPDRMPREDRIQEVRKLWSECVNELAGHGWAAAATDQQVSRLCGCAVSRRKGQLPATTSQAKTPYTFYACRHHTICPFCYTTRVVYPLVHTWRDMLKWADRESAAKPDLLPPAFVTYQVRQPVAVMQIPGLLQGLNLLIRESSRMRLKLLGESFQGRLYGATVYCMLSPTEKPRIWEFRYSVHAMVRGADTAEPPPASQTASRQFVSNPTLKGVCSVLAGLIDYPVGRMLYDPQDVVAAMGIRRDYRAPVTQRFGACRNTSKLKAGKQKGDVDGE